MKEAGLTKRQKTGEAESKLIIRLQDPGQRRAFPSMKETLVKSKEGCPLAFFHEAGPEEEAFEDTFQSYNPSKMVISIAPPSARIQIPPQPQIVSIPVPSMDPARKFQGMLN